MLDLSWTFNFTDLAIEALRAQDQLRVLKLRGCEMSDLGIRQLLAWLRPTMLMNPAENKRISSNVFSSRSRQQCLSVHEGT